MAGSVVGAGAPPVAAPVLMRCRRRLLSVQVGGAAVRRPWPLPAQPPVGGGALAAPPPPRVPGDPWPRCRPASGGWGLLATVPPPRVAATAYVCDYASYEFCDAVQYLYETFLKTNIPKIELGELHQIHRYSNILSFIYNLNTIVLKETTTFAKRV